MKMKNIIVLFVFVIMLSFQDSDTKFIPDGRIVGGEITSISDLPHQLSLMYYGYHLCGASIISEDWAVTAAHCVDGRPADSLMFRSRSTTVDSGGSIHRVQEMVIHKKYDPVRTDWDIAVVKVSQKFVFGPSVQPIQLQSSGCKIPAGTPVVVSGWGSTSVGGACPISLNKVTVNIIDHKKCNEMYSSRGGITERMICAGVEEGGKDACQSDAGGPLITYNPRVLVGIVSWGTGCGLAEYPGVYTDISELRDWIKMKTGI